MKGTEDPVLGEQAALQLAPRAGSRMDSLCCSVVTDPGAWAASLAEPTDRAKALSTWFVIGADSRVRKVICVLLRLEIMDPFPLPVLSSQANL